MAWGRSRPVPSRSEQRQAGGAQAARQALPAGHTYCAPSTVSLGLILAGRHDLLACSVECAKTPVSRSANSMLGRQRRHHASHVNRKPFAPFGIQQLISRLIEALAA